MRLPALLSNPVLALILIAAPPAFASPPVAPVIDMHVHAYGLDVPPGAPACPGDRVPPVPTIDPHEDFDPSAFGSCENPLLAPADELALMEETLAALRGHGVRLAMTEGSPERVARWREAAPDIVLPGMGFGTARGDLPVEELRAMHARGELAVLGEVYIQYRGHAPDDPRYAPYFALAEELDIPVGIHLGEGPPASARFPGYDDYRVAMGSPLLLEPVLRKYPKLRIYVMHYGSPMVDEMIAMMFAYPNLYVDIACNNWAFPRTQFHDALKRMTDAGLGKRILFGSDQMYWPGAIGEAIKAVEEAPFLDASEKRDILYDNAARFLRLSPEQIAAHHGK